MGKTPAAETLPANHYCTFRLAGALYGFDIRAVREVSPHTVFTTIPHAPPEVRGYVNLRGQIFLVLDLRRLLGLESAPVTSLSRLLLFKPSAGESFGVLVDEIGDIVSVPADQTEAWQAEEPQALESAENASARELIVCVGKLADELLIVMHAQRLLPLLAASLGQAR
jgi:purine-binding chemotaxis protein CheW